MNDTTSIISGMFLYGDEPKGPTLKIKDKGDGFSYLDEDADLVNKLYTYVKINRMDKSIPFFASLFFDEDGHLCCPTRNKEGFVDLERYWFSKKYDELKDEIIFSTKNNLNVQRFLLNYDPYSNYDYKFLNKELATLLLEFAEKVETEMIKPNLEKHPEIKNYQYYITFSKNKAIFQKRIKELDNPKKPRKNALSKIQPEDMLPSYDDLRPIMNCIHHENGFNVCSDGHFLMKQKAEYPSEAENKNEIPKRFYKLFEVSDPQKDKYFEGSYPNYEGVIRAAAKLNVNTVHFDPQDLHSYLCSLSDFYKKQTGGNKLAHRHSIPFYSNGKHIFSLCADFLPKWIRAAFTIGANSIRYNDDPSRAIFAERIGDNGEGNLLVMSPRMPGDTRIDDNGKVVIDADYQDIRYRAYDFGESFKFTSPSPDIARAKLALVKVKLKLQLQLK